MDNRFPKNKFPDRRFGVIEVALVFGEVKNSKPIINHRDYINSFLKNHSVFESSNFSWVSLAYRLGIKNDLKVKFGRISKAYGDLPIALELDMEILMWADQHNLDLLYDIYMIAGLEALLQVAKKYKLPTEALLEERKKFGTIPNTIEECKAYVSSAKKP